MAIYIWSFIDIVKHTHACTYTFFIHLTLYKEKRYKLRYTLYKQVAYYKHSLAKYANLPLAT